MYDLISGIIDHSWATGDSMQQYIMYVCCVMIPLLTVVFVDAVRSVFRGFMGRRK